MATTKRAYYEAVRIALETAAKNVVVDDDGPRRSSSSSIIVPHPIVEFRDDHPEQMYEDVIVENSASESVLIESSTNSFRVSVKIKQNDVLEKILTKASLRFLTRRAEAFKVVRKKAAKEGYDVSFLITKEHCKKMRVKEVVEFVVHFLETVDKETNEQKLSIGWRGRAVAEEFLLHSFESS